MAQNKLTGSEEVNNYLTNLEHPFKAEIKALREIVLHANNQITELIKWNAPSFSYEGNDRITMRIHPPRQVQLIFHCGAKVQAISEDKLITDDSGMLSWKANDRAVATFKNMQEIKSNEAALIQVVNKWLAATSSVGSKPV